MAHVEQIEIAICQNNALAGTTPLLHALWQLVATQNFLFSHVLMQI
jgi:hypothetical protein